MKKKRQQRPWSHASPSVSGVKDKPLIEVGGIKLLEAALKAWETKNGIQPGMQWRSQKRK